MVVNMEAITGFSAQTGSNMSFLSRIHLFRDSKLSRLSLTSWPLKPAKFIRRKAATTRSCDGNESNRKFRKFPLSKWTDRFHSVRVDATEMDALRREMDTLKPNVRKTLMSSQAINSMKKRILMIYLLVRLGLVYHFENEIKESLKEGFQKIEEMMAGTDDLYTTSIIFWVFKTYGHHISTCKHSLPRHVMTYFRNLKGNNGMYKKCLSGDAKGLLALWYQEHDFASNLPPFFRYATVENHFFFIVDCFEEFEREMMLEGNSYCVEATKKEDSRSNIFILDIAL
ncbi:hypothetical protein HID58_059788 [Brassica napus]|uniref:Terpene synthase N-terminal domain-containing protein n=1 Tax=Brassica napus TaxID=3708 RepID=A0ABQ7ZTX6_BRANA|nr:hypothetical protein HID58_059788 [Brassica napus]